MSRYSPVFRSTIAVELENRQSEIQNLKLTDLSGVPVILLQGRAADLLQQHFAAVPAQPGDVVDTGGGLLAQLTLEEFYLFGKLAGADLPTAVALDAPDQRVQATDLTHGKAILKLSGSPAAEALSKICGLDFHPSAFANLQAKQTSAAKIKTLIARCDENDVPTYYLHVDRPLGQYFWDIVWDAGQEFGVASPAGA
jgi:heterotetrameric sarcosine oxidase gamma subunit